jgi:hypothetical protein
LIIGNGAVGALNRGLYIYQLNPVSAGVGFVYNQQSSPSGVVEAVGGVPSGTIAVGGDPVFAEARAIASDVNGVAGNAPSLLYKPSRFRLTAVFPIVSVLATESVTIDMPAPGANTN